MLLHLLPSRSQSLLSSLLCESSFGLSILIIGVHQQVSCLAPKQRHTSFLLTSRTCCSVTVMQLHTTYKRNTSTLAFDPASPTKVSEFRGHLVHGSNMAAGCIYKDFITVCRSLATPDTTSYLHYSRGCSLCSVQGGDAPV